MKKAVLAVAVFVLAGVAGGFHALAQDSGGKQAKQTILRIGTTNELDSLNPFKALEAPSYELFWLQYDLLVGFAEDDMGPVPDLAQSWETSKDELTWTYHLNPKATWQDGRPVTAEDVKYTYERILKEKQGLFIDYLSQIDSIKTPDDHTLVIRTKTPSVQMLSMWVPILPRHVWEKVPSSQTKTFDNEPTIGSGPFQVEEWSRGQFLKLKANKEYFRGAPHVDGVIFQFYDNPDTMVQALKRGEVDYITNIPAPLFRSLKGQQGITTLSSASPGFTELGMNSYVPSPQAIKLGAPKTSKGNPALTDERVRQAINWAIDENALTDKILLGEGQVGSTIVPPTLARYHLVIPDSQLMGLDIDRSKQLLAQAGFEDTNNDGYVDKGGKNLELRLFARSESSDTVKAAQLIQGWLKQAGVKVDVKPLSDNSLTDVIYETDYDMFIWGWGSDPDPDFIMSVLSCKQIMGWSDTFWCNKKYTQDYQKQKTQLDLGQRAQTIKEMQRIAYESSPYVVFFYDNQLEAFNSASSSAGRGSPRVPARCYSATARTAT